MTALEMMQNHAKESPKSLLSQDEPIVDPPPILSHASSSSFNNNNYKHTKTNGDRDDLQDDNLNDKDDDSSSEEEEDDDDDDDGYLDASRQSSRSGYLDAVSVDHNNGECDLHDDFVAKEAVRRVNCAGYCVIISLLITTVFSAFIVYYYTDGREDERFQDEVRLLLLLLLLLLCKSILFGGWGSLSSWHSSFRSVRISLSFSLMILDVFILVHFFLVSSVSVFFSSILFFLADVALWCVQHAYFCSASLQHRSFLLLGCARVGSCMGMSDDGGCLL